MFVTSVLEIDKRKKKVILEDGQVFSLYNSEVRRYKIEAGQEITDWLLKEIEENVLYPRAKERALYLIGNTDKTKKQLEDKLKASYYPEKIIFRVITLLEEYGYIDDVRFANSYIKIKSRTKSMRQIQGELLRKGIDMSIIKECMSDESDDEYEAINKILNKSKYKDMLVDREGRNKVVSSLLRRGFEYEQITRCIDKTECLNN